MKKIPPKYVVNLWMKMSSYQLPLSHSLSSRPDSVCSTTLIQFLLYFLSVIFLFYFNFFPSIFHPIPCFPWHAIAMLLLPLLMVAFYLSVCLRIFFLPIITLTQFYSFTTKSTEGFFSFFLLFVVVLTHTLTASQPQTHAAPLSPQHTFFSSPIRHEHSFVVKHFYMLHSTPQPLLVHLIRYIWLCSFYFILVSSQIT